MEPPRAPLTAWSSLVALQLQGLDPLPVASVMAVIQMAVTTTNCESKQIEQRNTVTTWQYINVTSKHPQVCFRMFYALSKLETFGAPFTLLL